jgi:hypothetical protein
LRGARERVREEGNDREMACESGWEGGGMTQRGALGWSIGWEGGGREREGAPFAGVKGWAKGWAERFRVSLGRGPRAAGSQRLHLLRERGGG